MISMGCGDGQAMNRCTSMTLGGAEVTICTCDQSLCNKSGNLILDSKLIYFILFLISIANRTMWNMKSIKLSCTSCVSNLWHSWELIIFRIPSSYCVLHCTEVRFVSFLSGGFTAYVSNKSTRKETDKTQFCAVNNSGS